MGRELVSWRLGGMGENSGLDVRDPKLTEYVGHFPWANQFPIEVSFESFTRSLEAWLPAC